MIITRKSKSVDWISCRYTSHWISLHVVELTLGRNNHYRPNRVFRKSVCRSLPKVWIIRRYFHFRFVINRFKLKGKVALIHGNGNSLSENRLLNRYLTPWKCNSHIKIFEWSVRFINQFILLDKVELILGKNIKHRLLPINLESSIDLFKLKAKVAWIHGKDLQDYAERIVRLKWEILSLNNIYQTYSSRFTNRSILLDKVAWILGEHLRNHFLQANSMLYIVPFNSMLDLALIRGKHSAPDDEPIVRLK